MAAAVELGGGCHCGAVRFTVRASTPVELIDCNCSICAKTGFLHLTAGPEDFTLLSDPAALAEYRFGTRTARHLFCRTCGIKSFYVPRSHPGGYSVNWRALEGTEGIAVNIVPFDGRGDWEASRAALE